MQNGAVSSRDHVQSFAGALTPTALAHRRRCKGLPPVQSGEVERLKADFLATRGVTACPARYAAPIEQQSLLARSRY